METLLHVGLMKSGTTSLQQALAGSRSRLAAAGVLYPDLGQYNQMLSFVAVLQADEHAAARMPPGLIAHHREIGRAVSGSWESLVQQIRSFSGDRLVVSAENLVYAGPRTAESLVRSLPGAVTVLVTYRTPSDLVPSNFQQQARIARVGDFDTWAGRELRLLDAPEPAGTLSSLRLADIEALWSRAGAKVELLRTTEDKAASLGAMWRVATGEAGVQLSARASAANVGHPAHFIDAVQLFLERRRGLSIAETRQVVALAGARHRRRGLGSTSWRLLPQVAAAVDELCLATERADTGRLTAAVDASETLGEVVESLEAGLSYGEATATALRDLRNADRALAARRAYRRGRAVLRRTR